VNTSSSGPDAGGENDLRSSIDRFLLARAEKAEADADALRHLLDLADNRLGELGVDDLSLRRILDAASMPSMWTRSQTEVRGRLLADTGEMLARAGERLTLAANRWTGADDPLTGRLGVALLALGSDLLATGGTT
jgi:hypothetical protein